MFFLASFWTKCWNQTLVCQSQHALSSSYIAFVTSAPLALVPVCGGIMALAGCKELEAAEESEEARKLRSTVRPREKNLASTLHPTNFSIMWNHRSVSQLWHHSKPERSALLPPREKQARIYLKREEGRDIIVINWRPGKCSFWLLTCSNIISQIYDSTAAHMWSDRAHLKHLGKWQGPQLPAQPVRTGPWRGAGGADQGFHK